MSTNENYVGRSLTYLALGDSYTIGESVAEKERWPILLKESLAGEDIVIDKVDIIATTGWRTDELKVAMMANDNFDYDIVSLLIGVNNQYQGKSVESYESEFEKLLQLAIERAGGDSKRVFVVSIPDYGFTPFGESSQEKITKELAAYNSANKKITKNRGIRYFNITPISKNGLAKPELVAEDGLHPSGKQYALWVQEMMKNKEFFQSLKN